jgi:folate-dependent phosphoribosylglycinamide formyltransferase PurN
MTGTTDTQLDVALLVDDEYIEQWRRNAVASLAASPSVEITYVFINERMPSHEQDRPVRDALSAALDRIRQYPLWSLVGVARCLTDTPWYHQPAALDSINGLSTATRLSCTPESVDEYWNRLPAETIRKLESVDVAVRFGFGMSCGDILTTPTYGVLSYHPGDIRAYRGQPCGFWEFLNDEPEIGVTVQRLTDTLDGGEIAAFEAVEIDHLHTWQDIRHELYSTAEKLLVPAVEAVADPDRSLETPDELGDLYSIPTGWAVLEYLWKNSRGRIRKYRAQGESVTQHHVE